MSDLNQMEADRRREQARSFGPAAELYDAVRPTYPSDGVRWALEPLGPGRHRVADIGAGTGILTRVVSSLGHDAVAIEPDAQMREQLRAATAGVEALDGAAEALPLPDGSVAGAVAGQAYHWFDGDRAHRELARVLRPGGVFAAIWNERDTTVPWLFEYSRILDRLGTVRHRVGPTSFGDSFEPVERAEFHHAITHTPDSLVSLMQSRSYYITASRARQVELVASVRRLIQSHPDLAGADQFPVPYVTEVYRAVRS